MSPVKLSLILDGMEHGEEETAYLNKKTGQLLMIMEGDLRAAEDEGPFEDGPEWEREIIEETRDFLEHEDDYVALPTKFDIHEYNIMRDFCESVENEQISSRLLRAIQGSGAFRRFKDLAHELGVIDRWYRYRQQAFKSIATEWCDSHEVPYIDDVVIADEKRIQAEQKQKQYAELEKELRELTASESDLVANAANMAALIFHSLPEVNWAGFYFLKGGRLVLGPFQGKSACTRIALGKGVCGTAAAEKKTIIVPDVSKFPGHIACDKASKSEIALPLVKDNTLLGILDIDSPALDRFDKEDQKGFEGLVAVIREKS
jgi:L-methionine (R)-S-oxide reductase